MLQGQTRREAGTQSRRSHVGETARPPANTTEGVWMKRTRTLVGGLVTVGLALCTQPALAATASTPTPAQPLDSCATPALTQPFAALKDRQLLHARSGRAVRRRRRLAADRWSADRRHDAGRRQHRRRAGPAERVAGGQPRDVRVRPTIRTPASPCATSSVARACSSTSPTSRTGSGARRRTPASSTATQRLDAVERDEHPAEQARRVGSRPASPSCRRTREPLPGRRLLGRPPRCAARRRRPAAARSRRARHDVDSRPDPIQDPEVASSS